MTTNMTDEVYAYTSGPFILQIAIKAQRPEMALELPAEEGGGLATASVAGALGAEEDKVLVWAWAGGEWRWDWRRG